MVRIHSGVPANPLDSSARSLLQLAFSLKIPSTVPKPYQNAIFSLLPYQNSAAESASLALRLSFCNASRFI